MTADPAALALSILYYAVLKRLPDSAGLAYWVQQFENGMDPNAIVQTFIATAAQGIPGTPTDVATVETIRDATAIQGGTPGFVNSTDREVDNVGTADTSFEWTHTNILNSAAPAGTENVADYNQVTATGSGETWGEVNENFRGTGTGSRVGEEIDIGKPAGSTGQAIGLDIVNKGGEDVEIQGGDGEVIWRDRTYPMQTYIKSMPNGAGFQFYALGDLVGHFP